ncbi:MAG: hypothetical protein ABI855_15065 [Bacteroidota bacterium]
MEKFMGLAKELNRVPTAREYALVGKISASHFSKLKKGALKAGYKNPDRMRMYNKEQLLEDLKSHAAKLGRTPSGGDLNNIRKNLLGTYIAYFGRLSIAQKLAGLTPNAPGNTHELAKRGNNFITEEQCIEDLKNLHQKLGHKPTWKEIKEYGSYHPSLYKSKLGNSIFDYIQYKRQLNQREYSPEEKEQMLDYLKELAYPSGHIPHAFEWNAEKKYAALSYRKCFGSLRKALKLAGIAPISRKMSAGSVEEKKEALLADLKDVADRLGHTPVTTEMIKDGKYGFSSYKLYFGSWSNAVKEAGLVPSPNRGRSIVASGNAEEKKERLLANLKEVAQNLGHTPNTNEIKEGQYSLTSYKKYFGSLGNAAIQAGLQPNMSKRGRSIGLPADELQAKVVLLSHLKDLAHRLQHTPSAIQMDKEGDYTYLTYKKYFGSWKQAQMLAGLKLNPGGLKRIADREDIVQIKKILLPIVLKYLPLPLHYGFVIEYKSD